MSEVILVVDDEQDLLDMISYNLAQEGYQVHTALDGVEGVEQAKQLQPDLIVLDVLMPEMDGLEACRRIREHPDLKQIPILMLTALEGENNEIAGLESGADDYLTKPISPRLLSSRIRALLRRTRFGQAPLPPVVEVHDLVIDADRYVVERKGEAKQERITLPRKQFQLLHFLSAHAGRTFSRNELLDAVWEEEVRVVPRTVDVHVRRLRQRIGDEFIETVTGVGYRFKED